MNPKSASAAKKESNIGLFALEEQRSRAARAETVGQGQVTIVERITGAVGHTDRLRTPHQGKEEAVPRCSANLMEVRRDRVCQIAN
jgi:hypothetical protein